MVEFFAVFFLNNIISVKHCIINFQKVLDGIISLHYLYQILIMWIYFMNETIPLFIIPFWVHPSSRYKSVFHYFDYFSIRFLICKNAFVDFACVFCRIYDGVYPERHYTAMLGLQRFIKQDLERDVEILNIYRLGAGVILRKFPSLSKFKVCTPLLDAKTSMRRRGSRYIYI